MKNQKRLTITIVMAVLLFVSFLAIALPVQAAEIIEGDGDTPHVVIDEPVNDDLIVSAEKVTINAPISGDLIVSGTSVILNSTVEGTVFAGGQTIKVSKEAVIKGNFMFGAAEVIVEGKINGSVYGGAATIFFENGAQLGRNVYVGGYNLELSPEAVIARDLYAGLYQVDLSGMVKEDAVISAEAMEFKGSVAGNMTLEMSDPELRMGVPTTFSFPGVENPPRTMQAGLDVDESAHLGGELKIISGILTEPRYDNIAEDAVTVEAPEVAYGDTTAHHETSNSGGGSIVFTWMRRNAGRFISLCIVGALLLWLCRKPFEETVEQLKLNPWKALGYGALVFFGGFLAFFLVSVAIVILLIVTGFLTLGTLSSFVGALGFSALGLVFAAFRLAIRFISKLVIAYWLGRVILKASPEEKPGRAWLAALIGISIYAVARALPVLGWFLGATVTLFGFGAIVLWCLKWWNEHHPKKETAPIEAVEEFTIPKKN